ncbi:Glutathione S-transferase [Mycena indigotica]|uniref:glutathione transferase n=1 Tax=Mycena indigotica TaxID=2126181 RepID=A0A8H6VWS2_9AGAR|nr:Glutathione S-transferase [Mycena indigotica]KAF7296909.1 Glutathione S-transferase [Mycena indigotica]
MVVKLYAGARVSGGSSIVATVLLAKNIPYEHILVDVPGKQNKGPEHLAIHPFGQIPVLDDNGFILYETRAICKYLENKYPGHGQQLAPVPTDAEGQAIFDQMLSVEVNNFYRPMFKIVQEVVFNRLFGIEANQTNIDQGVKDLGTTLDVYETVLAKQKYLTGGQISLVDLYHLIYTPGLAPAGVDIMTRPERPNVTRYFAPLLYSPILCLSSVGVGGGMT